MIERSLFKNVNETAEITGLSRHMLYVGAKSGTYPHIMAGKKILFNIPQLVEVLNAQSLNTENKEG